MANDPNDPSSEQPGTGPGAGDVPPKGIVAVTVYLVLITSLLIWGISAKWPHCEIKCSGASGSTVNTTPPNSNTNSNADAVASPSPVQAAAGANPGPAGQATPTPDPLEIDSVSPKTGLVDGTIQVTIKGKGFKPGMTALFGGQPVTKVVGPVDAHAITVQPPCLPSGDVEVDVAVKNVDGASEVAKAAFNYACPTAATDLFWLVIFAGALGGTLHSLRSLYWYVGVRKFIKSWTLMLIVLPFTGATMALVFYAVIRAGFLPVQPSKNASVVFVVFGLLVGLFSQQAAVKLKDIFEAFLAKPSPGTDAHPQKALTPGADGGAAAGADAGAAAGAGAGAVTGADAGAAAGADAGAVTGADAGAAAGADAGAAAGADAGAAAGTDASAAEEER